MASELIVVELPRSLARSLHAGHPWVYKEHLPARFSAESGSFVRVRSGGFSAYALYDAESPLALRIFSRTKPPDVAWIRDRVSRALALREATGVTDGSSAYRWIAGEGDGLPGVTVDRYAGFAVVGVDGDAFERLVPWVVEGLREVAPLTGVVRRRRHARPEEKIEILSGRAPPHELVVEENRVRFRANLFEGQKTGLFLDQRDNRQFVRSRSAGRRVLNLFGYTGGFSVYAALGGAAAVTTVDSAEGAVRDAEENFRLNGLDPDAHDFVVADVFEYLRMAAEGNERFDLVVCDPPSFARNRTQR
ncbi:MAG TPA: class I SAM-dependent rRNA methyltransferase, partial [Polyangiaceae bacterium]